MTAAQEIWRRLIWFNWLLWFVVGYCGFPLSFLLFFFFFLKFLFLQVFLGMGYRFKANILFGICFFIGLLAENESCWFFHTRRKCASINYVELFVISLCLHLPKREKGGSDFIVWCNMCHGMLYLLLLYHHFRILWFKFSIV